MSEPSTPKILLAMTCVFSVAIVLIGFGRQQNARFERHSYRPISIPPGKPVEMASPPAPAPRQTFPINKPSYQAAQSSPVPVQANQQASWPNPTEVENFFNSTPLESQVPPLDSAQPPVTPRYQLGKSQLNRTPSRKHTWPTQAPESFADSAYVQRAAATTPITNGDWDRQHTDFQSLVPEPDMSTRPQHVRANASRLPADHGTPTQAQAQAKKGLRFRTAPTATQKIANYVASEQSTSNSIPTVLELELEEPTTVRVDKQVRKVNWAEIAMAPAPEAKTVRRPLQQISLPLQHTTPQVEAKVREQVRYGQSLARRRAFFAAREELIRSLLLIASSHHTEAGTDAYPASLAQALVAMDETSDLMNFPGDTNSTQFQQTLRSHQTQLIAPQDIQTVTPMHAIGIYSSFAQAKIEQAIGMSAAGSEALHALGKLESMTTETNMSQARINQTKTLVFYRAAININPSNTTCANDLGVLLYKIGQLQESEYALKASLKSAPTQLTWNNLALVHNQLAATAISEEERNRQRGLAASAAQQAQQFANAVPNVQHSDADWATTSEFQNNAAFPNVVLQNTTNRPAAQPTQPGVSKSAKLKQKLKDWF